MSISATRKVTSSASSARKAEKIYSSGGQGESFVENIDTSNNVSVRDGTKEKQHNSNKQFSPPQQEKKQQNLNSASASVSSVIEALAMSGVYDVQSNEDMDFSESTLKIGVYDNNQSIIQDEDRGGKSYLKHFYEKNEIIEEVDEFI